MTPNPPPAASLTLPLRLPYSELSQLGTAWAAGQVLALPLPTAPTLHVTNLQLSAAGPRLTATISVQSSGLLGLKATFDLSGKPVLDRAGQMLTLEDVALNTRRTGLSGRLLSVLADARVTAYLAGLARVDLGPRLSQLRAQVQGRLPLSPVDGVEVAGTVTELAVVDLRVTPDALFLTVRAGGDLHVMVKANGLLPPEGLWRGSLR